jgi:hypothetical protein
MRNLTPSYSRENRYAILWHSGRAIAEAVNRLPLTAEAPVSVRFSTCWICGGYDTETGFSPIYSVLPCQYHSTVALHAHTSSEDEQ